MSGVEALEDDRTLTIRAPAGPAALAPAEASVNVLLLLDANGPPRRIPLDTLPLVIGRAAPAALILDGSTVSRRHCQLTREADQLLLSDLGSTNGTFVDGVRIDAPTRLEDGARITIGAHTLRHYRRGTDEVAGDDAIDRELREASDYVTSILPAPIPSGPVEAAWLHRPCARVGGDAFGYQMLDERHFGLFLLDVAGHGAGAALYAVSVANVLRQRLLPDVDFRDPAAVIASLNRMFPMERHNALFFTIWYGVYDTADRVLAFAAAGHHAAFLLAPPRNRPTPLVTRNPAVGLIPDGAVSAATRPVPPGSTLLLFSDGIFEIVDREGRDWGLDDLAPLLPRALGPHAPQRLHDLVRAAARPGLPEDDISVLALRFP